MCCGPASTLLSTNLLPIVILLHLKGVSQMGFHSLQKEFCPKPSADCAAAVLRSLQEWQKRWPALYCTNVREWDVCAVLGHLAEAETQEVPPSLCLQLFCGCNAYASLLVKEDEVNC